ncbi:thioredoxin-like protein [Ordospora colligata]|nr:thioredoxin-like protein [Ordospora colligata]
MPISIHDCSGFNVAQLKSKIKDTKRAVFIKFSVEGCAPCRYLKDDINRYKTDFNQSKKDLNVDIFEINGTLSSTCPFFNSMCADFQISAFPTMVMVDQDMKPVGSDAKIIGSKIEKFKELINSNSNMFKASV